MSRLRVNKLTNKDNNGAPEFVHGVTISGVATATKFKGDGSELTSVPSSFTVLDSGVPSGTVDSLNFGNGISIDSTLNSVATISVDTSNLASLSGATFTGDVGAVNVKIGGTLPSTPNISLNSDGSATFAASVECNSELRVLRSGNRVNLGGSDTLAVFENNGNFAINWDGSASFGGTITAGPIDISSSTGYGAQVDMEPNAATVKAQCQQTASQYTELFAGYMGSNKYFAVNAQGDATFNGTITAGAYSFANLTEL
tara:strand:+ start:1018 stop:1788 length:771 start_codon:yes stop_codon:yes gene_type:complete